MAYSSLFFENEQINGLNNNINIFCIVFIQFNDWLIIFLVLVEICYRLIFLLYRSFR